MSESNLQVTYKPPWKLLIDREMERVDPREATCLSVATIVKLGRDKNVTAGVRVRICQTLSYQISHIVKVVGSEGVQT